MQDITTSAIYVWFVDRSNVYSEMKTCTKPSLILYYLYHGTKLVDWLNHNQEVVCLDYKGEIGNMLEDVD